ncbi:MAG: hypothetical protein JW888_00745 [Pirellulales bacterium]|nr:hypothetical protein [Pirellulales bacterium]
MPRFLSRLLLVFAIVLVFGPPVRAGQSGFGERLLPKSTKGVFLVTNVEYLTSQWEQTQLGQLMNDPAMEPFAKDLRRQFQDRFSRLRERLGLKLDDLRGVPSGEMDVAMIQPAKEQAAVALLVDVAGHLPQAKELLGKVSANLIAQGAKRSEDSVGSLMLIVFDVPESRDYPAGQVAYFLCEEDSLLGAADNMEVMKGIIRRKMGQGTPGDSLGDVPSFKHVMGRCQKHTGETKPQIRWFIDPLSYIECVRTVTPESKRRQGVTVLDVFRDQGFCAIQGIGGYIDFKVGQYEILHRTSVYAPGPYVKAPEPYKDKVSMDMLTFPNSANYALPSFIPNDVATCTMFHWDILKAFDNFGPTFDELFGEGETGIWDDVLESLKEDEDGPQIDLRKELIQHLDHRVTVISDYVLPITTKSERLLFAIRIKPDKVQDVADGVKKMLKDDPTIRRRVLGNLEIWETVEQEQMKLPDAPTIDLPNLAPKKKETVIKRERRFRGEAEDEEELLLPHAAVTVANGHLLIASHYDFLVDILERAKKSDLLADSPDYKTVDSAMRNLGARQDCLRAFSRTDEEYRPTYELIRMGKMPEAETMFGRMLNSLFGPHKKGFVRKQQVDGSEMPDYDLVRGYLGPAGTFGKTEEDGWFVVGFMLKKGE